MKPQCNEIKSRLGTIIFLDLTHLDITGAHRELGTQVREQVWRVLDRDVANTKPGHLTVKIKQAKECWSRLHVLAKHLRV
jgi:hypothetical protein